MSEPTDDVTVRGCPMCGFNFSLPLIAAVDNDNELRQLLQGAVEVDIQLAPHGWFGMWKDGKKLVGESVVPEGRYLLIPLKGEGE